MEKISSRAAWLVLSAGIAAMDQFIKLWIRQCPPYSAIVSVSFLLELVPVQNNGAAFSTLSGRGMLLVLATTVMLIGIICALLFDASFSRQTRCALAILLGGGVGNWIDRVAFGSVTDYIRLMLIRFPVFNFADICITLSVFWLMILLYCGKFEKHRGEKHGTGH